VGLSSSNFDYLGKQFASRGQIPLIVFFFKIRHRGGCPRSVPSRQISRLWR